MYTPYAGVELWYGDIQMECERIISRSSSRSPKSRKFHQFNPCIHYKMLEPGNFLHGSTIYKRASLVHLLPDIAEHIKRQALSVVHLGLDFQKNNDFQLLTFLADWDSTLKMFLDNNKPFFTRKPEYGEVKWGWLPLLNDAMAVCRSIEDIQGKLTDELLALQGKRLTRRFQTRTRGDNGAFGWESEIEVTIGGYLVGEMNFPTDPWNAFEALLDEIGFHPDLATIWEIIPLSFMVDRFLPVGGFLESLHPRGWFCPKFNFDGSLSIKATIEMRETEPYHYKGFGGYYTYYERMRYDQPLPTRPQVDPEWTLPEPGELQEIMFDFFMIFTGGKSK